MSRLINATSATLALTVLAAAPTASAQLLYDVDFSSPTHTVGQPPTTGGGPAPRDTISSINFGNPTVVDEVGCLSNQPCEISSADETTDQILLNLADLPANTKYQLKCNLIVEAGPSTFTILLDTPLFRRIDFLGNGTVNQLIAGQSSEMIGTYTLGRVVGLRVNIDLVADTWEIRLNEELVHSGDFGGATELRQVRFSTPTGNPPPSVRAAVDDIEIFAGDPNGCEEDLDGSGAVDFGDILRILSAWGPCP